MVKTLELIAIVSIGLLLFGCTQPPAQQQAAGETQQQATAGATQLPSVQVEGGQTQGNAQATQDSGQVAAGGLTGLGFEQLLALNTPVECDVRVTSEGKTYPSKIFFLNGQFRLETEVQAEGKTFKSVVISKNGDTYMDLSVLKQQAPETIVPCDWLKMEPQPTQGQPQPAQPVVDQERLRRVPPVDFKCKSGTFGNEKFNTPGKVCTSSEWLEALTGGAGQIPQIPT